MSNSPSTSGEVVVRNVVILMKHRGVTRTQLSDRMSQLGFGPWQHEKTIRNVFNGDRRINIDELIGLAVALNVTAATLLDPNTELISTIHDSAVEPPTVEIAGNSDVYSYALGLGDRDIDDVLGFPDVEVDWINWDGLNAPPVRTVDSRAFTIWALYRTIGETPVAAPNDLTDEDLEEMRLKVAGYLGMDWLSRISDQWISSQK